MLLKKNLNPGKLNLVLIANSSELTFQFVELIAARVGPPAWSDQHFQFLSLQSALQKIQNIS